MKKSLLIEKDPNCPWKAIDVRVVAKERGFSETLCALELARDAHKGIYRKDGRDNLVHSYRLDQILIYLGVFSDPILATALLHDVPEDVREVTIGQIIDSFNKEVSRWVFNLTDDEWGNLEECYNAIFSEYGSRIVKLADRFHNLSNLMKNRGTPGFFPDYKIHKKAVETNEYVISRFRSIQNPDIPTSTLMFWVCNFTQRALRECRG